MKLNGPHGDMVDMMVDMMEGVQGAEDVRTERSIFADVVT